MNRLRRLLATRYRLYRVEGDSLYVLEKRKWWWPRWRACMSFMSAYHAREELRRLTGTRRYYTLGEDGELKEVESHERS